MKVLVLLLLSLQGYAEGNCGQDRDIKIMKNNNATAYQLQLCNSNNKCTTPINFISLCNKQSLCDYCKGTSESPDEECGVDCEYQEYQIDKFLGQYCQSFDQCVTCLSPTPTTITPTTCSSEALNPLTTTTNLAIALGVLTCLFLVILVLIVTGWMWTCWTMKRKIKETQVCKNNQEQESEEERFCLTHVFKKKTQPVVGTAIEQLDHSLEGSGQSNNGLSSKDNKGHRDVNRVENLYTSSEGSSNSSLQREAAAVNRTEEGESGEKHMYHVLEKPGGDDYEDPNKDLENTAMEYEIPLPLKEVS